ncbi:MAG: hypothetical protein RL557_237 [archaeon]|jgi:nucleoside-diphosphate-sugar epimerase
MIGKGKKILITGHEGFIGSHLYRRLNGLRENVMGIGHTKKSIAASLRNCGRIDFIVHLAAKVPQVASNNDYSQDIKNMSDILQYCEQANTKLIFSSTLGVYGNPDKNPVKETAALKEVNEYVKSKIICEKLFLVSKVQGCICRLFNVYGKGQHESFVIPSLIKKIKNNEEIFVSDTKRDFIYIDDVIEAILKVMDFESDNVQIFNVGYGKSYSIHELALFIEKLLSKKQAIHSVSEKEYIRDIYADISKAKKLLHWKPVFSLEEGLKKTI